MTTLSNILFVSDLDGTLLSADSRLSPESVDMLNEAIGLGAKFSVATARTPATVDSLLEKVHTRLPFVVMTGATLWNPTDRKYSCTQYLPAESVEQVLQIYRRNGFSSFIYTLRNNHLHIYHTGPLSPQEIKFMEERIDSPYKTFHIPADGESHLPPRLDDVVLFYGIRESEISHRVHSEVKQNVDCSPLCYHDIYGPEIAVAEVFASSSTKARGIRTLAQEASTTHTIAFGDNVNDIPMLRDADLAVAVGNAVPEVLAIADVIIKPNTENSVARFILETTRHMQSSDNRKISRTHG